MTLALAAVLANGCGVSSVNDLSGQSGQFTAVSTSQAAPKSQDVSSAKVNTGDPQSAIRKVALNYSAMSDPSSKAYKVGPLDILEISVFKVPDLSKTIQVSESGTINYPLLGEVAVSGRTARDVEQDLSKKLGAKYLQKPQITVFIKEHNSQRVTIEGAVKKPGVYPVAGGLTLLQLVAQTGGFDQDAEENILLFREVDGKRSVAKFDVSDIRYGRSSDPKLEAGDVVIAPTSDVKVGINAMFRFLPLATLVPLL